MKRSVYHLIFIASFVFIQHVYAVSAYAAVLKYNPLTTTTGVGNTISVEVKVDSTADQIAGTGAVVIFDSSFLEFQSVSAGTHFPIVTNTMAGGKLEITAVVDNSSQYKTGEGTVATVTFKALKAGTTTLTYYCDLTKNDTSKIAKNDINATNIIECSANGTHTVTIGATGTGTGGTGTGTTGGTSGGTGTTYSPSQLPQSGAYDNVFKFAIPGVILLVFGAAMRMFVRV